MARSTPPDPNQPDLFEGRNPLAARREPARIGRPPVLDLGRATAPLTPRQRAQHFAAKTSAKRVRPPRSSAGSQTQRVIVKARVVRMGPSARKALLTHVRYVVRDGAGQDGNAEQFFDRTSDHADGRAFVDRCTNDRHHFRLIVNPEEGRELPDLKGYARTFMAQVERDLGTEIDWMGGAHYDTGRPHLHLLMRGKRDDGRDLILPREYVSHGLRNRAQEIATELLGPRRERTRDHERDVQAEGFTDLDRRLLQASRDGELAMSDLPTEERHLLLRRLTHLETRGLVVRDHAGVWRMPDGLRAKLQEQGEAAARERAATKALYGTDMERQAHRLQPLDLPSGSTAVGAYVGFAPLAQADGAQALVLDLIDGRLVHLRMPSMSSMLALDRVQEGAVVELRARDLAPRASDVTIAEIAAQRGGVYSFEDHRAARPQDRPSFIERHIRRLEATSREGACDALGAGRFRIPPDYPAAALAADRGRQGGSAVQLCILDHRPVAEQVHARAYTFLDRTLRSESLETLSEVGFGAEVRAALVARADHLRLAGLASGEPPAPNPEDMKALILQEIQDTFGQLGAKGKGVFMAEEGRPFSGIYVSRTHICGRAYAVIEGRSTITLAPWREPLEACRSQALTGVLRDGAVDFRFGRMAERDRDVGLER